MCWIEMADRWDWIRLWPALSEQKSPPKFFFVLQVEFSGKMWARFLKSVAEKICRTSEKFSEFSYLGPKVQGIKATADLTLLFLMLYNWRFHVFGFPGSVQV